MGKIEAFKKFVANNIEKIGKDRDLSNSALDLMLNAGKYNYSYNFSWMGRPIIQYPQDMMAMQEIFWEVKPDLVIETGIAHGGSLIMYASFMELLGKGHVLGIDIEIREHNRKEIEKHPMFKRISMLEGSSTSDDLFDKVKEFTCQYDKVLVVLDSNHTHDHVFKELQLYSTLVCKDSYLVVFDTIIEDMPRDSFPDRSWGKGNNPKTAVREFLENNDRFIIDKQIENKLLITVSPDGFLKCVKNA
ncbi:MAG: cephalosporin hydroxylase [Desulfobacula sp.]|nr:cephalosporin hydroxylase [Desulfobacula sp.]